MPFHFATDVPGFMLIFLLLRGVFWLGLLGVAVYLVKKLIENNSTSSSQPYKDAQAKEPPPLEIARRRYARGEIDKEEFRELKAELEEN